MSALLLLVAAPCAPAKGSGLKLSEKSAVPGQVVLLSGKRLDPKKAKVAIGGKKAEVATRSKRKLGVVVPDLKPGKSPVVAKQKGKRLKASLKVGKGFDGTVEPELDAARAVSAEIGPGGGVITATGADGTVFTLSVPGDAVFAPTTITLTPVARLAGLPGSEGRLPAVQFGPDGLVFARAATLTITPIRPLESAVGFAYAGNGSGLTLERAELVGQNLVVSVEHFSGAGATSMTVAQFQRLLARLSALPMSLPVAAEFYVALRAAENGFCRGVPICEPPCEGFPTCEALKSDADQLLGTLTLTECEDTAGTSPQITELVSVLNLVLALEGNLQALGLPPRAVLPRCREELTRGVVDLTNDTTQSDPLGVSGPCAGVVGADYDRDGRVRDLECGLYAAFIASMQAFPALQSEATRAAVVGLRKILDEGKAKCDQAFSHEEGLRELRMGSAMAAPFALLTAEVIDALEYCVKITVSPPNPTVEVGEELDFTATAKDPSDISFAWSADRGTIDGAGLLTAPTTPGPLTVTATSDQHHERAGRAQVTVTCPQGQVEHQGQCREVEISIDPTQVTLLTAGTQQFTATVTGISDTRVSWSASCGTVTQAGFYTAPEATGTCTVTAASVASPSTQAAAVVDVGDRGLPLTATVSLTHSGGCEIEGAAPHIAVGGSVTWENNDDDPEKTVEIRSEPDSSQAFSLVIPIGGSGSVTFPNAGSFRYICDYPFTPDRTDRVKVGGSS